MKKYKVKIENNVPVFAEEVSAETPLGLQFAGTKEARVIDSFITWGLDESDATTVVQDSMKVIMPNLGFHF